jgi:hypothetical protein
MLNKGTLTVCMLLIAFPITGREKKIEGEVFDQQALTEVGSYCVEEGGLSDSDRYLVDGFLKTESKPKHLLTKLPWKLVEGCGTGSSDAIAKVAFVPLNRVVIGADNPNSPPLSGTDSRDPDAPIKVVLTVTDSSQKLLYRTEALPLMYDVTSASPQMSLSRSGPAERQDALWHAFSHLIEDLLALRGPTAK